MFSSIHLYFVVHSSVMSYGFLKLGILNRFNVNTEVCIWEEFCKLKFSRMQTLSLLLHQKTHLIEGYRDDAQQIICRENLLKVRKLSKLRTSRMF